MPTMALEMAFSPRRWKVRCKMPVARLRGSASWSYQLDHIADKMMSAAMPYSNREWAIFLLFVDKMPSEVARLILIP